LIALVAFDFDLLRGFIARKELETESYFENKKKTPFRIATFFFPTPNFGQN